jgi:hypothetical protein
MGIEYFRGRLTVSAGARTDVKRGGFATELGVRIDVVPDDLGTGCGGAFSAPD